MIGAVSFCHHGFENARTSKFPTWNETTGVQSFLLMRNPTPPLFSLGLWRNTAIMATPEQKAFCVMHFVKHESVVSAQQALRPQSNSDPPSHNSIRRWYKQFQTTGAFAHEDLIFCPWPARTPDLTPCDYFLWDFVKVKVFVPPQPTSTPDLKNRITAGVETITADMADGSVAGIGLSARCVPCDQRCTHWTFVGIHNTLVELFFHYC